MPPPVNQSSPYSPSTGTGDTSAVGQPLAGSGPQPGRSERELYRPPPPKAASRPQRPPPGISSAEGVPGVEQPPQRSVAPGGSLASGPAADSGGDGAPSCLHCVVDFVLSGLKVDLA